MRRALQYEPTARYPWIVFATRATFGSVALAQTEQEALAICRRAQERGLAYDYLSVREYHAGEMG